MPSSFRAAWVLLVTLLAAGAAHAQGETDPAAPTGKPAKKPPPVVMDVQVGLHVADHDVARKGQLNPIRVILSQNAEPISGRLELRSGDRITDTLVDLPPRGRKVYTLAAPLAPDAETLETGELSLLVGRKVLAHQKLSPQYREDGSGSLILCSSVDGTGLEFLSKGRNYDFKHLPLAVSYALPEELPQEWSGYLPADVVVFDGRVWSRMSEEQRRAFRTWVNQGGRAILCGETSGEWKDPEGLSLAGVVPTEMKGLSRIDCLKSWTSIPYRAAAGTVLSVSGPLAPGSEVVFREEGRPLVVMRQALRGRVLWLGFDPFRESLRDRWYGLESFWRQALRSVQQAPTPELVHDVGALEAAKAAANSLPRLPAPPMAAIIGFGIVYAFIFGPLNIWMLRRLRRTVRSWLFVPSLALGMTLVVLTVGQAWGNGRIVLNSLSLVEGISGGRTGYEQSMTGLFSPTNRSFDLGLDDPAPMLTDQGSGQPGEVEQGVDLSWPRHQNEGAVRWDSVALQLFATRVLRNARPRDLGSGITVNLSPDGGGMVENGSRLRLQGAYLCRGKSYYWLGELKPGAHAAVRTAGWARKLGHTLEDGSGAARLQENRVFRDSFSQIWSKAHDDLLTDVARRDEWLIAECADFNGGLQVTDIPYNNRAGLLVLRVPEPQGGSRR